MIKHSQYLDLQTLRIESVFVSTPQKFHMIYGIFNSEFGAIIIAAHEDKIAIVEFGTELSTHKDISFERDDSKISSILENRFDLLLIGTEFQCKVWKELLKIQNGETVSYSQLALSMGIATSTRAVASAVARNKIAYFVPCHRVIPISGRVGNYRWGTNIKKLLLSKRFIKSPDE